MSRLSALRISQAAGHNMLAAWCYVRYNDVKHSPSLDGCQVLRRDAGPVAYCESAFHELPPYVLQHVVVHLETAERHPIKAVWSLESSQEDCREAVTRSEQSYASLRWAQKTVEFREIGLERLFHGTSMDRHSSEAALRGTPKGTFVLRWSGKKQCYCTTVSGGPDAPPAHRLIYKATGGGAAAGGDSQQQELVTVSAARVNPEMTFKDLPAFIAKFTTVPVEHDHFLGEPVLKALRAVPQ